jgi:hypothetical protein
LVVEHRGYARAVQGYFTEVTPGKHQVHARVTTKVHPCPGNHPSPRVEPGRGVRRAEPRQSQGITRA